MNGEVQESSLRRRALAFNLVPGTTTTTTGTDFELSYSQHSTRETENDIDIFLGHLSFLSKIEMAEMFKCFWAAQRVSAWPQVYYLLSNAAVEEFSCNLEGIGVSGFNWEQESQPERTPWRGVFCVTRKRQVLFSSTVNVRTSKLSRWRPHLTIDRRTLDRDEE